MVPNLIWASYFFGPREIWAPKHLSPKKFGPLMKMQCNDFHAGTKFPGDHISWETNFVGTNFFKDQKSKRQK